MNKGVLSGYRPRGLPDRVAACNGNGGSINRIDILLLWMNDYILPVAYRGELHITATAHAQRRTEVHMIRMLLRRSSTNGGQGNTGYSSQGVVARNAGQHQEIQAEYVHE